MLWVLGFVFWVLGFVFWVLALRGPLAGPWTGRCVADLGFWKASFCSWEAPGLEALLGGPETPKRRLRALGPLGGSWEAPWLRPGRPLKGLGGPWEAGPVFYVLCFGFCVLGFGFWVLCFVFWVLCLVSCVLCFGFCVLCFVFCVLGFAFCVLCSVFCVLCFVFWVPGTGVEVLGVITVLGVVSW